MLFFCTKTIYNLFPSGSAKALLIVNSTYFRSLLISTISCSTNCSSSPGVNDKFAFVKSLYFRKNLILTFSASSGVRVKFAIHKTINICYKKDGIQINDTTEYSTNKRQIYGQTQNCMLYLLLRTNFNKT